MLERAARCLDSGAQTRWRPSPRSPRLRHLLTTSRKLHNAFWYHGACDLDLPTYCFETFRNLFEPLHTLPITSTPWIVGNRGLDQDTTKGEHDLTLDFLYPPQAKALIKRWSLRSQRYWQHWAPTARTNDALRSFASLTKTLSPLQSQAATEELRTAVAFDTEDGVDVMAKEDEHPASSLEDEGGPAITTRVDLSQRLGYLLRNAPGTQIDEVADEVWQTFELVSDQRKKAKIRKDVLLFLAKSSRTADAYRVVRIFTTMSEAERDVEVSSQAIIACTRINHIGQASRIHDRTFDYLLQKAPSFMATEALVLHCLKQEAWLEAFTSWNARHEFHFGGEQRTLTTDFNSWKVGLDRKFKQLPNLQYVSRTILDFLADNKSLRERNGGRALLFDVLQAFFGSEAITEASAVETYYLFRKLKDEGLSRDVHYETACLSFLSHAGSLDEKLERTMRIYWEYREDEVFKPTPRFLEIVLNNAITTRNESFVELLEADWRRFHEGLSSSIAISLMRWHSNEARLDKIEGIILEFTAVRTPKMIGFFYPILHTEAIRAGPTVVQARLRWMRERFDLTPDLRCWNILLHAYARQNDLDAVLQGVSKLAEAGHAPDTYTIGTVLGICARRGAIELARAYLRYAVESELHVTQPMYDSVVLAYVNDDNFALAFKLAEEVTLDTPRMATRMWTQIVASLATRKRYRRALKASRRMRDLGVPFDGPAYAALMRVFTANRQPGIALQIMSSLMRKDRVRRTALHFAILIDGYAITGDYETGMRAYARMLKDGIKPDFNVRLAIFKLHGLARKNRVTLKGAADLDFDSNAPEEMLEEMLREDHTHVSVTKGPQMLQRDMPSQYSYPAAYFDAVISVYGREKAYGRVKRLLEHYSAKQAELSDTEKKSLPLRFVLILMRTCYEEGDYEAVTHLWRLAKDTAVDMARSYSVKAPDREGNALDSLTESTSHELQTLLPSNSRTMIARHLDVYLKCLAKQQDYPGMISTITSMREAGFTLDNTNWNSYIQTLCQQGFFLEAFELTEKQLMPRFRGFNRDRFADLAREGRNKDAGMEFMGRGHEWLRQGQMHPLYTTIVRLRKVLAYLGDVRAGAEQASVGIDQANSPADLGPDASTSSDDQAIMKKAPSDPSSDSPVTIAESANTSEEDNLEGLLKADDINGETTDDPQKENPATPRVWQHAPTQRAELLSAIKAQAPQSVAAAQGLPRATTGLARTIMGKAATARTAERRRAGAAARRPGVKDLEYRKPQAEIVGVGRKVHRKKRTQEVAKARERAARADDGWWNR